MWLRPRSLLWLWLWPAAAAPIGPLAWEFPYAKGGALGRKKMGDIKNKIGVPVVAQWLTNPTRSHEVVSSIPGLAQLVRIWCCHELWSRSQVWL